MAAVPPNYKAHFNALFVTFVTNPDFNAFKARLDDPWLQEEDGGEKRLFKLMRMRDGIGKTLLHRITTAAFKLHESQYLKEVLRPERGGQQANMIRDNLGNVPLHIAAKTAQARDAVDVDMVKWMIQDGGGGGKDARRVKNNIGEYPADAAKTRRISDLLLVIPPQPELPSQPGIPLSNAPVPPVVAPPAAVPVPPPVPPVAPAAEPPPVPPVAPAAEPPADVPVAPVVAPAAEPPADVPVAPVVAPAAAPAMDNSNSIETYTLQWDALENVLRPEESIDSFRALLDTPWFQEQDNGARRIENLMRFIPPGKKGTILHEIFNPNAEGYYFGQGPGEEPSDEDDDLGQDGPHRVIEDKLKEMLKPERGGRAAWTIRTIDSLETPLHAAAGFFLGPSLFAWLVTEGGGKVAVRMQDAAGKTPRDIAEEFAEDWIIPPLLAAEQEQAGQPVPEPGVPFVPGAPPAAPAVAPAVPAAPAVAPGPAADETDINYTKWWKEVVQGLRSIGVSVADFRAILDKPEFQVQINGVPRLHNLMRYLVLDTTILYTAITYFAFFETPSQIRLLESKLKELLKPERGGQGAWMIRCGVEGDTPLHAAFFEIASDEFITWLLTTGGGSKAILLENGDGITPQQYAYENDREVIGDLCRSIVQQTLAAGGRFQRIGEPPFIPGLPPVVQVVQVGPEPAESYETVENYLKWWGNVKSALKPYVSLSLFEHLLESPAFKVQVNGVPRLHNLMRFLGPTQETLVYHAFDPQYNRSRANVRLTQEKIRAMLSPLRGGQAALKICCTADLHTPLHAAVDAEYGPEFVSWILEHGGADAILIPNIDGTRPAEYANQESADLHVIELYEEAEEFAEEENISDESGLPFIPAEPGAPAAPAAPAAPLGPIEKLAAATPAAFDPNPYPLYAPKIVVADLPEKIQPFKAADQAFDPVMQSDVTLEEGLADAESIVLKIGNAYELYNIAFIKSSIEDGSGIYYGCNRPLGLAVYPINVYGRNPLFIFKGAGAYPVLLEEIKAVIANPAIRAIELTPTETEFETVASIKSVIKNGYKNFYNQDIDLVGADHCQAGSNKRVYSITKLKLEKQEGGARRRTYRKKGKGKTQKRRVY